MRLSAFGLGVAFAFASLTMPGWAADSTKTENTRSSNGFSSQRDSKPPAPVHEAPRVETRPAPTPLVVQPQRRENGGFSADRPVEPPRANGGFTATPRDTRDNPSPPVVNRVVPQEQPRSNGGFSASPPVGQPPAPTRNANGFSNNTRPDNSSPAAVAPRVQPPVSVVDRLAARSQSQDAFRKFKQEQTVYKAPEVAPANQQAAQGSAAWKNYGTGWKTPDDYYRSRESAFARNPSTEHYYTDPPSYVQNRPNYGAYAAAFVGGVVLDRIMTPAYANWAYSHQSDPDIQQWHREMMEQSRDNAELRDKMAVYDRQIAELQARNAPKTEALPSDIDPALVVAPSTAIVATSVDDAEPSSGHPILWTLFIVFAIGIIFIAACVIISQRKRNRFA